MSLSALREALLAHGGTVAALVDGADPEGDPLEPEGEALAPGDVRPEPGPTEGTAAQPEAAQPEAAQPEAAQPGVGAPQRAARGPRANGRAAEYELLLEMILEGSLLHYGTPRVVATEDRDLALLLGDQLYALGLARLAEIGDLDSVNELADLISLLSQAQLGGDEALARAIWEAGAAAIGWGSSPAHEAAKQLARAGDAAAASALLQSAGRAL